MSNTKRKDKLRKSFFETCARAYQSLTGDTRKLCVCPICCDGYTEQALHLEEKLLTLEHVPPEALGGKELLLTCKKCNNTSGHTVDAAIHSRERHKNFLNAIVKRTGNYTDQVKLSMGGERLNFEIKIDNKKGGTIELRPTGNCPQSVERWKSQMEQYVKDKSWDGQKFKVSTIHGFHQWLSKIGDLRTAYLIAFAAFGYRYAFDNRLKPIRDQLENPHKHILDFFWSFSGWSAQNKRVLAIAHEPIELIFISLDSSNIILPWLDGPENPYEELASIHSDCKNMNFKGKEVPWPEKLRLELDFLGIKK